MDTSVWLPFIISSEDFEVRYYHNLVEVNDKTTVKRGYVTAKDSEELQAIQRLQSSLTNLKNTYTSRLTHRLRKSEVLNFFKFFIFRSAA